MKTNWVTDTESEVPQILYVEDDEAYASLVRKRLTRAGFQVTLCHDGAGGLDMILKGNYDLVLLDYHLPSMTGLELIEALASFPRPPLVIVSAENDLRTVVEAMRAGADDYVVKCTQDDYFELLLSTLDRVLAQRRVIEDRKKAEDAFWRQKQLMRTIIDNIPYSIFWKDDTGRYQGCNRAFCDEYGLSEPADVLNLSDFDLHPNPAEALMHQENDQSIMRSGKGRLNIEQEAEGRNGRVVQLVSKVPLNDQQGLAVGVLGIFNDITENKEMERVNFTFTRELREKNQQLQRQNEEVIRTQSKLVAQEKMASLGTMAAGIAHEIRNPLNFIQNMASVSADYLKELRQVMAEEQDAFTPSAYQQIDELLEDLNTSAEVICKHGVRAGRVVQSMSELAGGHSSRSGIVDFNAMVAEYLQLVCDFRSMNQVEVIAEFEEGVGEADLMAHNVGRAIGNMVNNAVDAVKERLESEPDFQPCLLLRTRSLGTSVEVTICDNGVGIAQEHKERIFEPFFTTKPSGHGNIGLGLAMSYETVVLEHGGELKVDSTPGQGTTFTIRLPRSSDISFPMPQAFSA